MLRRLEASFEQRAALFDFSIVSPNGAEHASDSSDHDDCIGSWCWHKLDNNSTQERKKERKIKFHCRKPFRLSPPPTKAKHQKTLSREMLDLVHYPSPGRRHALKKIVPSRAALDLSLDIDVGGWRAYGCLEGGLYGKRTVVEGREKKQI